MKAKDKKNLFLYFPPDLHHQVKVKAAKEQVSITAVAEALFRKWIRREIKLEPERKREEVSA